MDPFIRSLNVYFGQKAPALPTGVKQFLVTILPWLAIISVIFAIPAFLATLGLNSMMYSFGGLGAPYRSGTFMLVSILSLVSAILNLIAIPGLFKKSRSAWNLVFYSSLISVVGSLIVGALVSAVVSFLISMYLLFQVRSYYS